MSLQFIFGNSGSGKSFYLYQKIIEESRRHPEGSYLVIVPEQFTMQTQRDLVMLHPDHGIMNIDVLSFRRLAHRVFEEVGADQRTVLTETGKNLMLRRVAQEQKDKLKVLGARMNRTGYVSEVKSILSELMQYEVTDYDLQCMLEAVSDRPLLSAKLEDIRVLYRAFLEYQQDRFMKPEELMEVLARIAGQSKLLRKSVLAFDGYAGFTPSQLTVLEKLFCVCPKIYLTVTIDARENFFGKIRDYELFAPSRRMIRSVSERCREAGAGQSFEVGSQPQSDLKNAAFGQSGAGIEEPIVLGPGRQSGIRSLEMPNEANRNDREGIAPPKARDLPRFSENGALRHLEQNLFRPGQVPYKGESDEISLHVLSSPMQEVHFAARTIAHLVREGKYRYRDIAVIAGDLSAYGNYVRNIFPMYGISAFVDETRGLLLNPCLEFVRGALAMVQEDFSRESVFRFLRTGMAGFSSDEIDRLENYVIAAGIRGRKSWEQEWTWCPASLRFVQSVGASAQARDNYKKSYCVSAEPVESGDASAEEENVPMTLIGLDLYNALRGRFMERVGAFAEGMSQKGQPLVEYVKALYQLLEVCEVQQQLKDREDAARADTPASRQSRSDFKNAACDLAGAAEAARADTPASRQSRSDFKNAPGELASEYRQVYPILIGLLDEMTDLLGEERMDCAEFAQILDAGLSEAKIGVIPPGIDQVQVGDIRRSRLSNVKVLFFLGLNDGWVPARGDQGGIVSDTEREILLNSGAELAPSARENSYIQRFYLYQNLTKPQERLYLSWCQSSGDGTAMRPSYLVSVIERLFPDIRIQPEEDAGTKLWGVTSKENGMLYFLHGLQEIRDPHRARAVEKRDAAARHDVTEKEENPSEGTQKRETEGVSSEQPRKGEGEQRPAETIRDGEKEGGFDHGIASWLELYRMYLKDDVFRARVRELAGASFLRGAVPGTEQLEAETARELYGLIGSALFRGESRGEAAGMEDAASSGKIAAQIPASVTRLEMYAGCAFSHFAAYGLRLQERTRYGVKAVDLGNLFHESLELFSREMLIDGCDWGECPYEEMAARMDRCVEKAAGAYEDGILHGSAREAYTIRRLKRILRRTVWVLREQTRAGKFRPVGFEISFANAQELNALQVRLGTGDKIQLQGRIDRIDTAETEDTVYVKVVDYKSGMTQFDPVSLYYGLQLQLIVYLNAALEMEQRLHPGKKVIPAGVFYHRMQDPVLDEDQSLDQAKETLLKKMRPNGLVNMDGPILRLFDENMSGDSLVIPVGLKKDGTPKAASSVATTGQFYALSDYVTRIMGKMAEEILNGAIGARPFADKNTSACDYCAFADVCGFDRKIPGRCEKRTPGLDASEVMERFMKAADKKVKEETARGSEMDEGTAAGH